MYSDFYFPYYFIPKIPVMNERPPTLYSLLQSIVNFGKDEQTKISDLAKVGREKVFNFDYPLTDKVDKETFETQILNHFLTRRIGFDTFTNWQIHLCVKLNEIMPIYNKMFELMEQSIMLGEITTREGFDNRTVEQNNTLENSSNNTTKNTSDRRSSNTPQNQLENVRDGKYVTDYNYDTNNAESKDSSNSKGQAKTDDKNNYKETTTKVSMNDLYRDLKEGTTHIYSLIFKDLDDLFYQLV
jgi:hypothetical protein